MCSKQLMIGILTALFTVAMFGSAFAASDRMPSQSSEAGVNTFMFNAPLTKADEAAIDHNYDPMALEKVGSEAGIWTYRFDAPETKADMAARNHEYNEKALSAVATEGGLRDSGVLCANC